MAIVYACTLATLFAVASAGSCDGQDFACNHTDGKFVIEKVYMDSDSKVHWKANDTVNIKMSGHVNNFDVEAGTLHYKVVQREGTVSALISIVLMKNCTRTLFYFVILLLISFLI